MAEHPKFGAVAAEHDLTPQTDSKVAETEEMLADKVQTVTHDGGGLDNGTVADDNEGSNESEVVGAANTSTLTAAALLNYPAGISDGTQYLRASVTNLGAQQETESAGSVTVKVDPGPYDPQKAGRVLHNFMYRFETALDRRAASKLAVTSAGTRPGNKIVPKLVFMQSCLPAHLKAPTSAEIAAGATPVEQRELPIEVRRQIFKHMFEVEEPLCLDSPHALVRHFPAGMLKLFKTTYQPFEVEDDNAKFDVHNLLARQFGHRKKIASFLQIFGTCKEINAEAGEVLYGINKFTFLDIEGVKDILDNFSGRVCRQISKLLIKFEAGPEGHRKLINAIRGIHRNCANLRTLELKGVIMEATSRFDLDNDDEFERIKTNLEVHHIIPMSSRGLKVEYGYSYLEHAANLPSGIIKYKLLPPMATVLMTGHTKFFIKPYVPHFEIHNAHVAAREMIEILRAKVAREKAAAEKKAGDQEKAEAGKKAGDQEKAEAGKKRKADMDLAVEAGKKRKADMDLAVEAGKKRKADDLEEMALQRYGDGNSLELA